MIDLRHGDCLELMKDIPDASVDLVLTDPPYNIGKSEWDKIDNYISWCGSWLKEAERVIKGNGTLIFWHNDMQNASRLITWIEDNTELIFNSVAFWHKPNFRSLAWKNTNGNCQQRSWFNVFEFIFVFIKPQAQKGWDRTGLNCIQSNPMCFSTLKEWYRSELKRLHLTKNDISRMYTKKTGRKPYMLRHYFQDSQFEIPTKKVYESVYIPLGFNKSYEELRQSYEELRQSYEELRQSYEELRPTFNIVNGEQYSNYFLADKQNSSTNQLHPCRKPGNIIAKLLKTHSKKNDIVLDCFMGSGVVGEECVKLNRSFIGIEKEEKYFNIAKQRIKEVK